MKKLGEGQSFSNFFSIFERILRRSDIAYVLTLKYTIDFSYRCFVYTFGNFSVAPRRQASRLEVVSSNKQHKSQMIALIISQFSMSGIARANLSEDVVKA